VLPPITPSGSSPLSHAAATGVSQFPEKLIPLYRKRAQNVPVPVYGDGLYRARLIYADRSLLSNSPCARTRRSGPDFITSKRNERRNIEVVNSIRLASRVAD